MNELTKAKCRILARIENYIGDIEFAEEQELTEDEKTIFKSVKSIINEELEKTPAPLPRFIIDEDGKIKQFKTSDENTKEEVINIIKATIKEYLDKECDDVIELLLTLSKDLCERIRKGE